MICSYYTEAELETAKQVSDPELNAILQEVRGIDERYYIRETTFTTKRWVGPSVTRTFYSVLLDRKFGECQIWNFPSEGESSICTDVPKSYVMTLLLGFLNGYNTANDQLAK